MLKFGVKMCFFIIPFIIIISINIDYTKFNNLNDIFLGSIALSSSSLGFFIAGVSILQTSNISKYYKKLKDLGTDKKIMSWLMTAIAFMFILSCLSLISLFFTTEITSSVKILLDVWLSFLAASIFSTFWIILLIGFIFTK